MRFCSPLKLFVGHRCMQQDGDVDYRNYTLPQLKEALSLINRRRYPINHRNLEAEIAARPKPAPSLGIVTEEPISIHGFRRHSMCRIVSGFCWFLFVWFGLGGISAAVMGAIVSRQAGPVAFSEAYAIGQKVGGEFGRKYGRYFMISGLLVAVVGTAAGVLPGTRRQCREATAQRAVAADRAKPRSG
jgi:hypothetical protein